MSGPSDQVLRIDPEPLSAAFGLLADVAQRLGGGVRSADGRVRSVLGHGWSGGAASSFSPIWDSWHEESAGSATALTNTTAKARSAAQQLHEGSERL
ncbi:WXG100 family type VII secretion target [Mycobacteroides abscessus subsp. bolletii]|uniref:WXG100 family type VII secretion target n=1 Tax=Mycobacteroides abscessus TaxID=36809 RepID=UPI00092932CD|nr:WXG100 family type VII secretion target [Mycobacteroides abscessus]SHQ49106.1 WXG100 family type VII secretion target [Mycobacteroides abscessus subsp. bolletii]SHR50685.1 WXG100 family type VII secretion target [Mycobacteroides abscessus subsp. bolletii]SHS33833.1 WXG100 family type VII secretion target [Mycobacteroides abscessus subsp. bolletii]SHT01844.1 WXG100 family type VII secretion target [Mycobacteroides abscessus subsp. bolletii]SHX99288.1 WXG100 family type VII secretion target [